MTYTVAAALGIAGALVLDLVVLRTRLVVRRVFWATYPIVLGFQLVFNGFLTGRGVVRYDPGAILGPRLVSAPIEDLGFGFALVLTSLASWVWWEGRAAPSRPSPRGPRP
jgi:lycopene cyclase domain-containing protein